MLASLVWASGVRLTDVNASGTLLDDRNVQLLASLSDP